jgi:hypothetical protein
MTTQTPDYEPIPMGTAEDPKMPSRDVFMACFRKCKLSELRRRQRINASQSVRACRVAQLNDDRRPRMLEALGHLRQIEDYLIEAVAERA